LFHNEIGYIVIFIKVVRHHCLKSFILNRYVDTSAGYYVAV